MHKSHGLFLWNLLQVAFTLSSAIQVTLETTKGTVLGEIVESSGTYGEVYESIPFAQPPSGDRRFELPQPRTPWNGVLDVRNETACYHYLRYYFESASPVPTSHDCLRLKLVIPLDQTKRKCREKLPLLFWIHGGGLRVGGKYYYENSGILRNIASKKIIFAAVDYRMGFEGFVATENDELPGNLALEDIALGLKFLRQNAESIGFDVNNIIVAGESAGATMAGILAVSPRFYGQIHGAMLFSGFASGPLAISSEETRQWSRDVFKNCNCLKNSVKKIKECMKLAPPSCYDNNATIDYFFTPIIDRFRGNMAFIPDETTTEMVRKRSYLPTVFSNVVHELNEETAEGWVDGLIQIGYNGSEEVRDLIDKRFSINDSLQGAERKWKYFKAGMEAWTAETEQALLFHAQKHVTVYSILNDVFDEPNVPFTNPHCTDHGTDVSLLFDSTTIHHLRYSAFSPDDLTKGKKFSSKLSLLIRDFAYEKIIRGFSRFIQKNENYERITYKGIEAIDYDLKAYQFWEIKLPKKAGVSRAN